MTRPTIRQFATRLIIMSITVPEFSQSKTPKTAKGRAFEIPGKRAEGRSSNDRNHSNAYSQRREIYARMGDSMGSVL
jgi:hypothetical protein